MSFFKNVFMIAETQKKDETLHRRNYKNINVRIVSNIATTTSTDADSNANCSVQKRNVPNVTTVVLVSVISFSRKRQIFLRKSKLGYCLARKGLAYLLYIYIFMTFYAVLPLLLCRTKYAPSFRFS